MIAVKIDANFKGQGALHPDKFFNPKAVQRAERAAELEAKNEAIRLLQKTVTTWKNPPRFYAVKTQQGFSIWASDKRWFWLDQGTKVRYATMTPGYTPKSKVGVFYSYQGAGRVAYVSKRRPHPGIEPRGWSSKVLERVAPTIHRVYRDTLHTNWINP